jgi:uncharacterized membrane protein YGL010W
MDAVKRLNYSEIVKPLEHQMAFYAAYHRDARNRATHFFGVPAIMLSLFIPLSWLRAEIAGFSISAAMLLAAAVLLYYFLLDVALAAAMLFVTGILLWAAQEIASLGKLQGWLWFAVLFSGGWIVQLIGHYFEGRRPALTENLFQVFIAPIFLCAEVLFALGYKPELRAKIEERSLHLPQH